MTSKEVFSENLRQFMESKGISRYDICDAVGVGYTTVSDWIHGRKFPRSDRLDLLAELLGVPVSKLVGTSEERDMLRAMYEARIARPETARPRIDLEVLNEEGQKMLIEYYNLLLMKYKKEIK